MSRDTSRFPWNVPKNMIGTMTDPEETVLQRRVRERLDALGLKAAPLAKSAGLGESFVRDILRGRTASPSAANLQKLAAALDTSAEYLLGETDDLLPASSVGPAVKLADAGQPTFAGYVNAGLWRPVDEYFQQDVVDIPETVRRVSAYAKVRQYAYQAKGNSMDKVGISDGMWIVAADAPDFIDTYRDLESGDLVVVQRSRFQGAERELTVKEIRYYRDRYELHPRSSDPAHRPIVVPHNHATTGDDVEIKIVGVVLAATIDFRRR